MTDPSVPQPVLTERLELRAVGPADLAALYAITSDPATWRHHPEGRHTAPGVTERWIERCTEHRESTGVSYWMARLRSDGTVVGVGGAQRQNPGFWNLYYRLAPAHWGNGYATELCRAAIRTAVRQDPDLPVVAWIHAHNTASRAVAARLGLRDLGLRPEPWKHEPMHAYADRDLTFG
ncbi:GNAT family N-acetyltransferase [Kitasatospora sp. NPDC056138]|uniref:GNAT family N-acetyltransferase n=1 Tax=Kitasatospora sp. NPDC056138 TaxID=3345724 RepID=UPI0035D8BAE5